MNAIKSILQYELDDGNLPVKIQVAAWSLVVLAAPFVQFLSFVQFLFGSYHDNAYNLLYFILAIALLFSAIALLVFKRGGIWRLCLILLTCILPLTIYDIVTTMFVRGEYAVCYLSLAAVAAIIVCFLCVDRVDGKDGVRLPPKTRVAAWLLVLAGTPLLYVITFLTHYASSSRSSIGRCCTYYLFDSVQFSSSIILIILIFSAIALLLFKSRIAWRLCFILLILTILLQIAEGFWGGEEWIAAVVHTLLLSAICLRLLITDRKNCYTVTGDEKPKLSFLLLNQVSILSSAILWVAILAIFSGWVAIASSEMGKPLGRPVFPGAYGYDREQIQAAVGEFMTRPTDPSYNHKIGEVPIVNESFIEVNGSYVIPGEDYYVIAICPLLTSSTPKGILKNVPITAHPSNCLSEGANAEVNVTDCECTGSYMWLTTKTGDIASICIGWGCTANGEDGFHDVYP